MRLPALAWLVLATTPTAALAQHGHAAGSGLAAITPLWERMKNLYLRSAEQMPEEKLAFRPAKEVRSFGEILGHVANDHYVFCAAALGEKDPNTADFEKTTTRAGLVKALKDSFAYCDRAYRMADAKTTEEVEFFGNKGSRLWVLIFNVTHDGEHYGNLVTYFRINGMVPPSSQQGS
jgi:uncharacterized damage-inducible protein DinB